MKNTCILCNAENQILIEQIKSKDLIYLYKNRLNIDVTSCFDRYRTIDLLSCPSCKLLYYNPPILGDGNFYDQLQKIPNYYYKDKEEYRLSANYINAYDNVLEIGCGEGNFTNYIKYNSYVGLELSDSAIKKAKYKELNVYKEFIETHAINNVGKYDVVCYFQVLEHIGEPNKFISDSLSCLKIGGKLIIAVPSQDSYFQYTINDTLNLPPHHATRWKNEVFDNIAQIYGLKVISILHSKPNKSQLMHGLRSIINRKLRKITGFSSKQVDTTFMSNLLYLISYITSFFVYFTSKNNIKGHTVTVVYEK